MSTKFKIVVVEDNELVRTVLEMILKSEFNADVKTFKDGDEALQFIQQESLIQLIVSDLNMPNMNGDILYHHVKNKKIPFILVSGEMLQDHLKLSSIAENSLFYTLNKPFEKHELVELVRPFFNDYTKSNSSPDASASAEENPLSLIPLSMLKRYGNDSCDIYVKIHQEKLTKIAAKENTFSIDLKIIEEYEKKGIKDAYIDPNVFKTISTHMFNQIVMKARQLKKVTPMEIAGLQVNISLNNLKDLGINQEQIESVNVVIDETVQAVFGDKKIETMMKDIIKGYHYHVSHSILLMYVASSIIKNSTLPFQPTLKKIAMASFFHDLSLDIETSEKELTSFNPMSEPSSSLKKKLLEHPQKSSELLSLIKNEDTFTEIKKIILEHHERPNGSGYPRGLNSSQISPLSALFIVSHEIANCLYRNEYNKQILQSFIENIEEEYSSGNFRSYYNAAKKAFAS